MNSCGTCGSLLHSEWSCAYERVVIGRKLVPERVIPEYWVDITELRLKEVA